MLGWFVLNSNGAAAPVWVSGSLLLWLP